MSTFFLLLFENFFSYGDGTKEEATFFLHINFFEPGNLVFWVGIKKLF